jgi:hypothetical protein
VFAKGDGGHAGADTETFEGLVENEDGIERGEFSASDSEIQPYDHGVEYDAEFEEEESGDLLAE